MNRIKYVAPLLCAALILVFANAAVATYTPVVDTADLSGNTEASLATVLNDLLGWTFTIDQINAGAGSRLDDDYDQLWKDGTVDVTFTALWWSNANQQDNPNHKFGYNLNGGSDQELFHTAGSGDVDFGDGASTFIGVGDIRWWAQNESNQKAYSDPDYAGGNASMNGGFTDRMVTFNVTGQTLSMYGGGTYTPTLEAYLLCWDTGSDRDFQDLVVVAEGARPVPEPGTLILLGTGLIGIAGYGFRRKKKA